MKLLEEFYDDAHEQADLLRKNGILTYMSGEHLRGMPVPGTGPAKLSVWLCLKTSLMMPER